MEARFFHCLAEEARLTLAGKADILHGRLTKGEGRCEIARTIFIKALPAIFVRFVARWICDIGIDCLAVGRNNAVDKGRRAHAAFYLKGEDTCLNELRNGAVHAHVLKRKFVRTGGVFVENFARRIIDELVRPTAGL